MAKVTQMENCMAGCIDFLGSKKAMAQVTERLSQVKASVTSWVTAMAVQRSDVRDFSMRLRAEHGDGFFDEASEHVGRQNRDKFYEAASVSQASGQDAPHQTEQEVKEDSEVGHGVAQPRADQELQAGGDEQPAEHSGAEFREAFATSCAADGGGSECSGHDCDKSLTGGSDQEEMQHGSMRSSSTPRSRSHSGCSEPGVGSESSPMDVEAVMADARARMAAYWQSKEAQASMERMADRMAHIALRHMLRPY